MIRAENLSKAFGKKEVLTDLRCEIADGCIYGLVGANGAGKSTFLRIASGIYTADKGTVRIDGEDVFDNEPLKAGICFVADDFWFPNGTTVCGAGNFYASFYPAFDKTFYREHTQTLKLPWNGRISSLSKGMKRQVVLLCALACRCRYLFFDETFDGLDPVVRNYMKRLICSAVAENGSTVILTSHNLRELEDICDHLGILYKGGILFEGDVNNIKTNICKVQVVFPEGIGDAPLEGLSVLDRKQAGSVQTLIIREEAGRVREKFSEYQPLLLDILPLTLEEVFIYEMEVLGYAFEKFDLQ